MNFSKLKYIILSIIFFASCKKIKYYPDNPIENVETKILAHRGGGHSGIQENTLASVQYGLNQLDGVEVDIQLSKDRTIWLSHNAELPTCTGIDVDCFVTAHDYEIIELDSCLGNNYNFSTLDTIFHYIAEYYPEKYISLDVKAWHPCDLGHLDVTGLLNVIAEEIIKLVDKYNLHNQVMVESETATFLNFIKKRSNKIGIYLATMGDFERGMMLALESGYTGISFKYKYDEKITHEHVQLLHKKGLRIQLWTVNDENDILEAISLNPDFIQTDNIDFVVDNDLKYN
ncbi:MAG: glycerophosphodiester phosphodiesterase [Bacteroidales bacterium]|nr:glycerophosphodiester phosphodiesterase [Bacteroidales bacterium]